MRKLRNFGLAILLLFGGVFLSACKKEDIVLSENITLSETEVVLMPSETIEIGVVITPENITQKGFELVGDFADVAQIECDLENMKLIVTANDFVTADITEAIVGVRTLDDARKEAHLTIQISETDESVATPQNLTFDGDNIIWRSVDNANGYTLEINNEVFLIYETVFPIDLNYYAGQTITAKVKANGKSSNLDSAFTTAISFSVLESPKALAYNDETKTLSWSEVENAVSYNVYIKSTNAQGEDYLRPFNATTNRLEIGDYFITAGQYEVFVRANGNTEGSIVNSANSNSAILTKLSYPQRVNILNGTAFWNSVIGAIAYSVEYSITVDGIAQTKTIRTSTPRFDLPTSVDAGNHTFKIKAIGDGITTLTGDFGAENNFIKLEKIQSLRVEEGKIVWQPNNLATNYTIHFKNLLNADGSEVSEIVTMMAGADSVSYEIANYPAGRYQLDVIANGTNDKLSSDETGKPITVVKLAVPGHFQINKINDESVIEWDSNEKAVGYRLVLNGHEEGAETIEAYDTDKYVRIITSAIIPGDNYLNVKSLGGGYSQEDDVWYINSEYSSNLFLIKLRTPVFNMANVSEGDIAWNLQGTTGLENYTLVIKPANGDEIITKTLTQNKINLNGTKDVSLNLEPGDYTVTVKANAKNNSSYYSSDLSEPVIIRVLDTEMLSVKNGAIEDLENNTDENYKYKYFVNGSAQSSIKDYVQNTSKFKDGDVISVYAQKVAVQNFLDDVYYLTSNKSNTIYLQKLPAINAADMYMTDGILYFGGKYNGKSGFEFLLYVNDNELINKGTTGVHDFSESDVGDYSVKIKVNSIQEGDITFVSNKDHPWFINSEISKTAFTFTKLEAPQSLAVGGAADDEISISNLAASLTGSLPKACGTLTWGTVSNAIRYELIFDDGELSYQVAQSVSFATLQDIGLSAGQHTVKIRSIGNNGNLITSDFAKDDNDEILTVSFTKLPAPTNLGVENGRIVWEYSNDSDDPNYDLTATDLFSPNCKAAVYVLVDANGKMYSTINEDSLSISGENILDAANSFVDALKLNSCEIPDGLNGLATLKIAAIPLNSYITLSQTVKSTNNNSRYVMSDYSGNLNFVGLETPLDFKIENNRISWSGQRYNEDADGQKPLKSYEIEIKLGKDKKYMFTVQEKTGATYEIDTDNKIIYIDSLSNSLNCYWHFSKQNFENFFGECSYSPNAYSVSIKSIANVGAFLSADNGLKYYYYDSKQSNSLNVEVLKNPVLSVQNGIVVWDGISNAVGYNLYISSTAGITQDMQYISLEKTETAYDLSNNDLYVSGTYYFNIVSVGNGSSVFTSEFDSDRESEFYKLAAVSNIIVESGVINYSANEIINSFNNNSGCHYSIFVRSANSTSKYKEISNNRELIFELGEDFVGEKEYEILIRASGDNIIYLNSDFSTLIRPSSYDPSNSSSLKYPKKLATPSKVYVQDGKLSWSKVNNATRYKITISGQNTIINTINTYYDISNIPAGTYSVSVKAIGDGDYLNSTPASVTSVAKLSNITGLSIIDGYLTWDNISNSNYVANINGTDISINSRNSEIINGKVYYSLLGYNSGLYNIYLYNDGGTTNISSSKTDILSITKLAVSENLAIQLYNGQDCLIFDKVANASKYYVKITAKFKSHVDLPMIIKDLDAIEIDTSSAAFAVDSIIAKVVTQIGIQSISEQASSYIINLIAAGSSTDTFEGEMFIASDLSDDLVVTIPETPSVTAISTTDGQFSGKFAWGYENAESYDVADYYKIYVKNVNNNARSIIFSYDEELVVDSVYEDYKVYKVSGVTHANLVYAGKYDIIVVACQNKNGYDSTITSNCKIEGIEFDLFGENENGSTNPYQISTMRQFNAMQYNLAAKYALAVSEFEITEHENISTQNEMFVGEFDGNGADITISVASSNQKFIGLFDYIGESGIVNNFNLQIDLHSTTQIDGTIYAASVAGFNYGIIRNINVEGEISSEYNSNSVAIYNAGVVVENYGTISYVLSKTIVLPKNNKNSVYAGGIAAINYGTIELSGFTGNAAGQMAGGIVAQNLGGTIDQCYYESGEGISEVTSQNNGISHNYAGGLVAYMKDGIIASSYVNAKVTASTNGVSSNNTAYAGGLVGYIESLSGANNGLSGCYVVGYAYGNKSNVQISASGTYSFAGVFVGDNKVDSGAATLICVMNDSLQSKIGNSKSAFTKAQVVTNISTAKNKLGSASTNFKTISGSNYLKLTNAKYE